MPASRTVYIKLTDVESSDMGGAYLPREEVETKILSYLSLDLRNKLDKEIRWM